MILLVAACGPVGATSVVNDAEVALIRAHAANGERYAPYETTKADLYLAKAKEEQDHARYASAVELARTAQQYAESAAKKAAERKGSDEPPPIPRATIEHPGAKK
jgi:hypothetical protein